MAKPSEVTQYGSSDTAESSNVNNAAPPSSENVDHFHINADTDVRLESLHHTLGTQPTQAAPGDHVHDGGSSPLLLGGKIITGSKSDGTALNSIIQLMVRLGAEDQST